MKISFPEIKNEVFVNLLGYKGSDLIYLNRCKGVCMNSDDRPLRCKPVAIRERKVKMTVKAFRAGSDPRERVKDLILDDHTACGCECGEGLAAECAGLFNPVSCSCECPLRKFGGVREDCLSRPDHFWNAALCLCESRSVAPRGLPDNFPCHGGFGGRLSSGLGTHLADMILWLALGSSITLVIVLAIVTKYYRSKFVKHCHEKKRENFQESLDDKFTAESLGDEPEPRYSNSSASLEFQQSFPYKDQLENFLTTARREARKSRSTSLENILEKKKKSKNQTEVFYHQYVAQEESEGNGSDGYHENINV